MIHKFQVYLILWFCITVTPLAFSDPNISILWEQDITQADRKITPYTVKADENENIIRVVGVSCIYKLKENPRKHDSELFEYRVNLKDNKSELKHLMAMDDTDITLSLPQGGVLDSRSINNNIVMIRSQYSSCNFQELTIGNDWQVKTREIIGLTRGSVSTHGACRNMNGEVFLCGNSGYIRKVKSDGTVAWDTNYKSDKGEDGTFDVAFSESENMLVAFGFSFEPDTKFTTKDSSLWLANFDSEGNLKAETKLEGIANLSKFPAFCLSKSDNPIVIYDNAEMGSYKIYVSKFSKDLKKDWTTHIFDGNGILISRMSLAPLENDHILATFDTFDTRGDLMNGFHFYILDRNGNIVNNTFFKDVSVSPGFVTTVFKDKIFLVTEGQIFKKNGDTITNIAKLICFKINSLKTNDGFFLND